MKTLQIFLGCIIFFSMLSLGAQQKKAYSEEHFLVQFNDKIAPTILMQFKKDSAFFAISGDNKQFGLKRQTPTKFLGMDSKNPNGRYIGPIFWLYEFDSIRSSSTSFELDSLNQLHLVISFDNQDSIVIDSKQNVIDCFTRPSDFQPHKVAWSGKKQIIVGFGQISEGDRHKLKVNNLSLKGSFNRMDNYPFSIYYVKHLEDFLKRKLTEVFLDQNMNNTILGILTPPH